MAKLFQIISVLLIISVAKIASAQFYSDCVVGNDFGGNSSDLVTLYPINSVCYQQCNADCGSFSRTYLGQELNQPIINACMASCQSGNYFSSALYQANTSSNPPTISDIAPGGASPPQPGQSATPTIVGTTQVICDQSNVLNNVYQSNLSVNDGDVMILTPVGGTMYNTIYLCGQATVSLIPIFASPNMNDWYNDSSQTWWSSQNQHICLSYMNQGEWNSLTNQDLWSLTYLPFTNSYPQSINYFPPPNISGAVSNSTGVSGSGSGFSTCSATENLSAQDVQQAQSIVNNYLANLGVSSSIANVTSNVASGSCAPGGTSSAQTGNMAGSSAIAGFPGVFSAAEFGSPYGPCKWSADNYEFTNTGLWVADGDQLSISWYGQYSHNSPTARGELTNFYAQCMTDPTNSPSVQANCARLLNSDSSLQVMMPSSSSSYVSDATTFNGVNPYTIFSGEQARTLPIGTSVDFSGNSNPSPANVILGLSGSVLDNGMTVINLNPSQYPECSTSSTYNTSNSNCTTTSSSGGVAGGSQSANPTISESCQNINALGAVSNPACIEITNLGVPTYTYSGTLSGFSNTRSPLALRHFDTCDQQASCLQSYYSDNLGGYNVTVQWKGCPYYNGDLVQYQVAQSAENLQSDAWISIPQAAFLSAQPITISGSGIVFFMINIPPPPADVPSGLASLYTNPGNYSGQYFFTAQSKAVSQLTTRNGTLGGFVQQIHDVILGNPNANPPTLGAAEIIFGTVTQNADFITVIMAFLTFYVAFFAAGFLIGVVQLNQQEALSRMAKLVIVLMLISPQSWSFFSTYLLNMFIEGGIELVTLMVSGTISQNQVDVQTDPFAIFELFDTPLAQMFSAAVWKKIYGLVCTGLLGIIVALMIIYCIIMYTLSLVKATLIYIFSLMGIAILVTTAPVFICCILFQITRTMFDTWWKYLVSYTLQPIMVFATIAIFTLVLMALLMSALNFTVCSFCLLGIDLGNIYSDCWIPGYQTTLTMNMPGNVPNFYLPGNILPMALAFGLLGTSMYKLMAVITEVCSVLVTGQFIRNVTAAMPASSTMTAMSKTSQTAISTATSTIGGGMQMMGGKMGGGMLSKGMGAGGGGMQKVGGVANKAIDSIVEDNGEKG